MHHVYCLTFLLDLVVIRNVNWLYANLRLVSLSVQEKSLVDNHVVNYFLAIDVVKQNVVTAHVIPASHVHQSLVALRQSALNAFNRAKRHVLCRVKARLALSLARLGASDLANLEVNRESNLITRNILLAITVQRPVLLLDVAVYLDRVSCTAVFVHLAYHKTTFQYFHVNSKSRV